MKNGLSMKDVCRSLLVQKGYEGRIIREDEIVFCEIIDRKIYLNLASGGIVDYYERIENFQLTFEEIRNIVGIPIDHSFLKYKKELAEYGWQVGKISMKEQTVLFIRLTNYPRFLGNTNGKRGN